MAFNIGLGHEDVFGWVKWVKEGSLGIMVKWVAKILGVVFRLHCKC